MMVIVSPRRSSRLRSVKMTFGPKRFFTCEKRMSDLAHRRPRVGAELGRARGARGRAVARSTRVDALTPARASPSASRPRPRRGSRRGGACPRPGRSSRSAGPARRQVVPEARSRAPPDARARRRGAAPSSPATRGRARASISRRGAGFAWPQGSKRSRSRKTRAGSSPVGERGVGRNGPARGVPIAQRDARLRRSAREAPRRRPRVDVHPGRRLVPAEARGARPCTRASASRAESRPARAPSRAPCAVEPMMIVGLPKLRREPPGHDPDDARVPRLARRAR